MGNGVAGANRANEVEYRQTSGLAQDLAGKLGLPLPYVRRLFDTFTAVDHDASGSVGLTEFHNFFGVAESSFSHRVFGALDLDHSGSLDFAEFVGGVWNVCTCNASQLVRFAFELYDTDGNGRLDRAEMDSLMRMLHGADSLSAQLLQLLDRMDQEFGGRITLERFMQYCADHPVLIAPALNMQTAVRRRALGVRVWSKLQLLREKQHGPEASIADILASYARRMDETAQQGRATVEQVKAALEAQKREAEGRIQMVKDRDSRRAQQLAEEEQRRIRLERRKGEGKEETLMYRAINLEGVLTRAWKSVNRASNMATYDPVRSSEYKARLDRLRQRMRDLERALDQKWAKEFESAGRRAELEGRRQAMAQLLNPAGQSILKEEVRKTIVLNKGLPGKDPQLGGPSKEELLKALTEDFVAAAVQKAAQEAVEKNRALMRDRLWELQMRRQCAREGVPFEEEPLMCVTDTIDEPAEGTGLHESSSDDDDADQPAAAAAPAIASHATLAEPAAAGAALSTAQAPLGEAGLDVEPWEAAEVVRSGSAEGDMGATESARFISLRGARARPEHVPLPPGPAPSSKHRLARAAVVPLPPGLVPAPPTAPPHVLAALRAREALELGGVQR